MFLDYEDKSEAFINYWMLDNPLSIPMEVKTYNPDNSDQFVFRMVKNKSVRIRKIFESQDGFSEEENQLIEDFLDIADQSDEPLSYIKADILRYIYLANRNLEKAFELSIRSKEVMKQMIPLLLTTKMKEIFEKKLIYTYGRDFKYRPSVVINLDKISRQRDLLESEMKKAVIFLLNYIMQYMLLPGQVECFNVIFYNINRKLEQGQLSLKYFLELIMTNYPIRTHAIFYQENEKEFIFNVYKDNEELSDYLDIHEHVSLLEYKSFFNPEQLEKKFGGIADNIDDNINFIPFNPSKIFCLEKDCLLLNLQHEGQNEDDGRNQVIEKVAESQINHDSLVINQEHSSDVIEPLVVINKKTATYNPEDRCEENNNELKSKVSAASLQYKRTLTACSNGDLPQLDLQLLDARISELNRERESSSRRNLENTNLSLGKDAKEIWEKIEELADIQNNESRDSDKSDESPDVMKHIKNQVANEKLKNVTSIKEFEIKLKDTYLKEIAENREEESLKSPSPQKERQMLKLSTEKLSLTASKDYEMDQAFIEDEKEEKDFIEMPSPKGSVYSSKKSKISENIEEKVQDEQISQEKIREEAICKKRESDIDFTTKQHCIFGGNLYYSVLPDNNEKSIYEIPENNKENSSVYEVCDSRFDISRLDTSKIETPKLDKKMSFILKAEEIEDMKSSTENIIKLTEDDKVVVKLGTSPEAINIVGDPTVSPIPKNRLLEGDIKQTQSPEELKKIKKAEKEEKERQENMKLLEKYYKIIEEEDENVEEKSLVLEEETSPKEERTERTKTERSATSSNSRENKNESNQDIQEKGDKMSVIKEESNSRNYINEEHSINNKSKSKIETSNDKLEEVKLVKSSNQVNSSPTNKTDEFKKKLKELFIIEDDSDERKVLRLGSNNSITPMQPTLNRDDGFDYLSNFDTMNKLNDEFMELLEFNNDFINKDEKESLGKNNNEIIQHIENQNRHRENDSNGDILLLAKVGVMTQSDLQTQTNVNTKLSNTDGIDQRDSKARLKTFETDDFSNGKPPMKIIDSEEYIYGSKLNQNFPSDTTKSNVGSGFRPSVSYERSRNNRITTFSYIRFDTQIGNQPSTCDSQQCKCTIF